MTTGSSEKKLARDLQHLAADELGASPKLTTCYAVIREDAAGTASTTAPLATAGFRESRELKAARLFEKYRERLQASAERKVTEKR